MSVPDKCNQNHLRCAELCQCCGSCTNLQWLFYRLFATLVNLFTSYLISDSNGCSLYLSKTITIFSIVHNSAPFKKTILHQLKSVNISLLIFLARKELKIPYSYLQVRTIILLFFQEKKLQEYQNICVNICKCMRSYYDDVITVRGLWGQF